MRRRGGTREFELEREDKIAGSGDASQDLKKNHSTGVPLVTPVEENRFRGFGFVAS
jgi:hypothetical protein